MKIRRLSFIYLFSILFSFPALASLNYGQDPDETLIALGSRFPMVGFFSSLAFPHQGNGTLITLEEPEFKNLNGRVVMTSASILATQPPENQLEFVLGSERRTGKSFIHPAWNLADEKNNAKYNIALFILDLPLDVEGAKINVTTPAGFWMKQVFIAVEYGWAGSFFSKDRIGDGNKRASYTQAVDYQYATDHSNFCTHVRKQGTDTITTYSYCYGAACLNFSPITDPDLLKDYLPTGLAYNEGGGVFTVNESALIAIQSGTDIDVFDDDIRISRITKTHYLKYKKQYDAVFASIRDFDSDLIKSCTLENFVVSDEEGKKLLNPPCSLKKSGTSLPKARAVTLQAHKDWILETLKNNS